MKFGNVQKNVNSTRPGSLSRGFTLIEMMVALSMFTIVMTIALGSLLTLIDANRKSQAVQSLMTNINFVIDDISRNARVGTVYSCSNGRNISRFSQARNCANGGNTALAFESDKGSPLTATDQFVYRYIAPSGGDNGYIEKSTNGGSSFDRVTDEDISIEYMRFYVTGARNTDSVQPKIIIVMRGVAGALDKIQTEFSIETAVAQRVFDF